VGASPRRRAQPAAPPPEVALIVTAPGPADPCPPGLEDLLADCTATLTRRPAHRPGAPAGTVVLAGGMTAEVWSEHVDGPAPAGRPADQLPTGAGRE
jgi:hypothetical protein